MKTQGREQTSVRTHHLSIRKGTARFPDQVTRHILRKLSRSILSQAGRRLDGAWKFQPTLAKLFCG
jgi:hypothetical protein